MPFFDHYPYTNLHNVNLDWVLQAVKSWGAMVEQNNQNFISLEAANESFKEYVTNYLTNLDVQDEINAKLDQMLASGALTQYFAPYIQTDVSEWLEENLTPTSPPVDASLTITGAAADAKATGDAIHVISSYVGGTAEAIDEINGYLHPETTHVINIALLEMGTITYASSGPIYSDSTKYIRTVQNQTLSLNVGDKIGLLENTENIEYAIYYKPAESNDWVNVGYRKTPYTATISGDYVLTARKSNQAVLPNVESIGQYIYLMPYIKKSLCSPYLEHNGYFYNATTINKGDTGRYSDYIAITAGRKYVIAYKVKKSKINDFISYVPYMSYNLYNSEKSVISGKYNYIRFNADKTIKVFYGWDGTANVKEEGDWTTIYFYLTAPTNSAYIRISGIFYEIAAFAMAEESEWKEEFLENALIENIAYIDSLKSIVKNTRLYADTFSGNTYDKIKKAIKHRGGEPENTLPGFKNARRDGFFYVETDIRKTSDGVYVLLHDETINRTARLKSTGGMLPSTIKIADITYAEANGLYDYRYTSGDAYAGTILPNLESFLTLCKNIGMHPYMQLENPVANDADVANITAIVKSFGLNGKVTYIVTSSQVCDMILDNEPDARIAILQDGATAANTLLALAYRSDRGVGNSFLYLSNGNTLTGEKMQSFMLADRPVEVWTVNVASEIIAMSECITGVCSDSLKAGDIVYNSIIN